MQRVLEPEVMNEPEQAAVYAGTGLDNAYWLFVQYFKKYFPSLAPGDVILDLGCGPAAIPIRLARLFPDCEIHAVDGSASMIVQARRALERETLEQQITLFQGTLPKQLPLPLNRYPVIISNSFLHHLADPGVLWDALRNYGQADAAILVIDLLRPDTEEQARFVVDRYLTDAPPLLQQDMLQSLRAAFTIEEVASQLEDADLAQNLSLTMVNMFQFAVFGRLTTGSEAQQ